MGGCMKRVDAPASRRSHRYPARLLRLSGGSPLAVFILGLLVIFSAALGSASANLGDSEAKINAAYGKRLEMPQIAGNQGHQYEKGGFIYDVTFRGGVSVFEMYARANQAELSSKEIAAFLKANAAGATWIPAKETPAGREWKRSDHMAKAAYFRLGGRPTLTVMEATRK
jgi:hypothetical protein